MIKFLTGACIAGFWLMYLIVALAVAALPLWLGFQLLNWIFG